MRIRKTNNSHMILPLTSMVDMFTILLVFLLKSFSTSEYIIEPPDGTSLPETQSRQTASMSDRLIVGKELLQFNEETVIELSGQKVPRQHTDRNDPRMIRPLFEVLSQKIELEEEPTHQLIVLADSSHSYQLMKQVFYTASMAGYTEVKMAGVSSQ